jgi:hypothetical protein
VHHNEHRIVKLVYKRTREPQTGGGYHSGREMWKDKELAFLDQAGNLFCLGGMFWHVAPIKVSSNVLDLTSYRDVFAYASFVGTQPTASDLIPFEFNSRGMKPEISKRITSWPAIHYKFYEQVENNNPL